MHRRHRLPLGIVGFLFLLGGTLSWAGPPNPTMSDPQRNTAGGTGALFNTTTGSDNTESIKNLGGQGTLGYNRPFNRHHPEGGLPMKLKVQLVVCADDGHEEQVQEVAILEKDCQRIEHLGLTLTEAKNLLATLQQHLVTQHASTFVAAQTQCDQCGATLQIKGQHTRTFRTLFGTVALTSPRLYHCRCQRRKTTTFRPLNLLLTEPTAPELLFMETKWASLVSYGLTAQALKDFLPVDTTLNATTVQHHTLAVAQRCEDELGEEQWAFVEGCPATWETLPIPDGPLTVGIDGGASITASATFGHSE